MLYHSLRALWALRKDGFLQEEGWFRSFRERQAVDRRGEPIPWMNYSAIEFFRERLKPEFRLFEFGSGNSTLFFASRCAEVVSFESSPEWHWRMTSRIPANVRLEFREGEEFYRCDSWNGGFDLVIVDGMDRNRLAEPAMKLCRGEKGVVVLDDSERSEFRPLVELFLKSGWKRLRFTGIGPIQNNRKETSFFYRPGNCLEI